MRFIDRIRRATGRRGLSLVIVLILLAAITLIAAGAASVVFTDIQVSRNEKLARQATFGAETGLEMVWYDFHYAQDVLPKDGKIDVEPDVNDLNTNNIVDFYEVFRDDLPFGSATSPVVLKNSQQERVIVWVEPNYPATGIATIHSECRIFANDGATVIAAKRLEQQISAGIGWKVQAPVNSAVRCNCCNNPRTCL
jgi:hypothetical protein